MKKNQSSATPKSPNPTATHKTRQQKHRLTAPIFLVGMMGSGKTRIGKMLADELAVHFIDIDNIISQNEKKSINDIFNQQGEDYFRKKELTTIKKIITTPPKIKIIASGGGAFINQKVRQFLKNKKIFTLHLDVPLWVLWVRVKNNKDRPLLHIINPRKQLKKIYDIRRPIYLTANRTVPSGFGSKRKNMLRLLAALLDNGMVKKIS
ncbi:MAG: shikimate kinase [Alphaproteobacteria bacterium]